MTVKKIKLGKTNLINFANLKASKVIYPKKFSSPPSPPNDTFEYFLIYSNKIYVGKNELSPLGSEINSLTCSNFVINSFSLIL